MFLSDPAYAGGGHIKWNEKDNYIIHSSVCYNHEYGSIEHRKCRIKAQNIFIEKCEYYRLLTQDSKQRRDKFCYSARNFNPLQ